MEDDAEVLDWGHEDDEQTAQRAPEDAEDAVSLGGDEDDMQDYYAYQASGQEAAQASTPVSNSHTTSQPKRDSFGTKQSEAPPQEPDSPQLRRSQSVGKLTHALPPKPVVSVAPVHPSPAQASTLASAMVQRERRSNGHGKPTSNSHHDTLPPDWELRQARSGAGEQYYYNIKTHESTWTRPVSGKSSPTKERDNGVSRGREGKSPSRRADSLERRTSRRETKRSADDLSYEDRHYRPGAAAPAAVGSTGVSDRRDTRAAHSPVQAAFADSYVAGRVPSPRALPERRRTRSLSPRRDYPSQDRSGRSRRDQSPPRAPERDITEGRQSNYPPRVPLDFDPSHRHGRARGRQDRMDVDVSPRNASLDREHTNRRGPNSWSAPRTRSPPQHIRAPSPPGARRFSRGSSPESSQISTPAPPLAPRQRARPDKPDNSRRASSPRGFNDFSVVDFVPQRRGREAESLEAAYGYDTKRRRVDDQRDDDLPSRRSSVMDLVPPHGLPARPQTSFPSPAQDDRPRRRAPLPPQSARYREARHTPGQEPLLPLTPTPEGSRHGYFDLPPRAPRDDDVPMRYADVPTNAPPLRRQGLPPMSDTEFEGRGRPPPIRPAVTSRPGSRFVDLPTQGPRDYVHEPMDVDRLASLPSQRAFDGPSRPPSSVYPDRMGDVPGDAPKAPRAMAREPMPNVPPPRYVNLEPQGPPPPHTSTWNMGSPSTSRGSQRPLPRLPLENLPKQPTFALPPPKSVSGTNLIPIGNRKVPPDPIRSPQERLPPASSYAAPHVGPSRGNDYSFAHEPAFGSPGRLPAPVEDRRRLSVSSAGRAESVADRLPARPVDDRGPPPSRPRGDFYTERKDRGPRVSRFGPERPPPSAPAPSSADMQPRVWMTKEESERLEMTNKEIKRPELTHKLPERPARTEPESRRPTDDSKASTRINGNHSRGDRDTVPDIPRSEGPTAPGRESDVASPELPSGRKSPVDIRPHGQRLSLEGRLGSSYTDHHAPLAPPHASLPPRPVSLGVYPEPAPRFDYHETRDEATHIEENTTILEPRNGEPSREVSPANSATRIHPDRARLLQTTPGSTPEELMKTSKPVRIKRPAKQLSDSIPPFDRPPPEVIADRIDVDARPDRLMRTGSSLLDRLSLNDVLPHTQEASSPSLRERVDAFSKGPGGDSYADLAMDADMDGSQGEASRSKGGRRRVQKPKRGRRSGFPA